jgi:hypothetical protein
MFGGAIRKLAPLLGDNCFAVQGILFNDKASFETSRFSNRRPYCRYDDDIFHERHGLTPARKLQNRIAIREPNGHPVARAAIFSHNN